MGMPGQSNWLNWLVWLNWLNRLGWLAPSRKSIKLSAAEPLRMRFSTRLPGPQFPSTKSAPLAQLQATLLNRLQ